MNDVEVIPVHRVVFVPKNVYDPLVNSCEV